MGKARAKRDPDWIQHSDMNKGGLHRALGIPEGRDIPRSVLRSAAHSKDHHLAAMAREAETLERMPHPKGHEPKARPTARHGGVNPMARRAK